MTEVCGELGKESFDFSPVRKVVKVVAVGPIG